MHRGVQSKTIKGLRRLTAFWNASSDMQRIVAAHTSRRINKWNHYFEIYDRHFGSFRGRPVTVLEIGVESGGSLELWRSYFGPSAKILGVDLNPKCRAFEGPNTFIRIGNQGDCNFITGIAAEFGPFDIIIEDGSHVFEHQINSFRWLFPHLHSGELYCCEDLCTSYLEQDFGGGVRKPGTGIEFFKSLLDDQNAWFARDDVAADPSALPHNLFGLHFYPTLAIVEKRPVPAPMITPVGRSN